IGAPIVAVTQPFLPPFRGAFVLIVVLAILAISFWRSATKLHGHARAGAQVIAATLAQQMAHEEEIRGRRAVVRVREIFAGLGETPGADAARRRAAGRGARGGGGRGARGGGGAAGAGGGGAGRPRRAAGARGPAASGGGAPAGPAAPTPPRAAHECHGRGAGS